MNQIGSVKKPLIFGVAAVFLIAATGYLFHDRGLLPWTQISPIPVVISQELLESGGGLWPDKQLERKFASYWHLRFSGRTEETFSMEAPHFQEMVQESYYKGVFRRMVLNELVEIEIRQFERETDHLFKMICVFRFKDSVGKMQETVLTDRWVNIDGNWYHLIRDPFVFRQAS